LKNTASNYPKSGSGQSDLFSLTEKPAMLGKLDNRADQIVCLVDDDPSVLKANGRLVASSGWKVESFLDPIAFLRYAESYQPEVAVIDILMPLMDGLAVQARLRTISPSTRVIILTSKDDPSVRSKAMAAGASAFFLKPADDDEFLASIESALDEG
jgi:two-component system, LuxR family, response regulator FixJ